MTGFGSAEAQMDVYHIKVEIKTLNSKFQDFILKLPRELSDKEPDIKIILGKHLNRGKINFNLELTATGLKDPNVEINEDLFKGYFKKFKSLADVVGADTTELFRLALQSPEVITQTDNSLIEFEQIVPVIEEAAKRCDRFRSAEGDELEKKMKGYIDSIRDGLDEVKRVDPMRVDQIRSRLTQHMEEVKDKVKLDPNRFEQEIVYYLEKLDITEEKVRLARHLDYFLEVMNEPESQGKKLGFISQEIGREINTMGAKANDADIQRAVVQMKDELEKIKEQTMNIL